MVWLVEQTVTLPDGTTETVQVPQVYLLVREGDLKGDGTLMAGRDVKLAADGDINNSGTIGARDATVMTAANIVNQAGGLIQGAVVNLAAREDLTNLVSLIKGDNVALSAGRDIALTSTSASENNGATWGSYISGVSRVDAGNLSIQAGRDVTLTAARQCQHQRPLMPTPSRICRNAGNALAIAARVVAHARTARACGASYSAVY